MGWSYKFNALSWEQLDYHNPLVCLQEPGNRNQLWRMTGSGMLQHEGASAPRDPNDYNKPSSSSSRGHQQHKGVIYVLDVSDNALAPGRETTLMLRRPDERRATTQRWQFTEDGRLCCAASRAICVQVRDMFGLVEGNVF